MNSVNVEMSYPLSPMQSAMLFHSSYSPHLGVYIEQTTCDLRESVIVPILEKAWHRVIERHAVLRTRFRIVDVAEPIQEVCCHVNAPLICEDWTSLNSVEQEAQFAALFIAEMKRGFDPSSAPLMRLMLFRLGQDHYRLLWTYHHALLDGRSARIVLREVFDSYDAFVNGQGLALNEPYPYFDYISWLLKRDLDESREYWTGALAGLTPSSLIADQGPIGRKELIGEHATVETRLSKQITDMLRFVALKNEVTLNTLVQGAWAHLVSRYSGEQDVVFLATRALRRLPLEGIREMVGLLINTVPVRVRVQPSADLLSWLKQLRSQWVGMREYEFAPLPEIIRWTRESTGTALFSSVMIFENTIINSAMKSELRNPANREFQHRSSSNYPLTVVGFSEPELVLKIGYDKLHFAESTALDMLRHLQNLLEGMPGGLDKPLKNQEMLAAGERQQFLIEWNRTARVYTGLDCVHRLFEHQVERSPGKVAVVSVDTHVTYRELNERANRLAHYLQKRGVGPETLVGICLHRSPDVLVAIMAVLKAGGAYVPLDASYPEKRLLHMISDARLPMVITVDSLTPRLGSVAKLVRLDEHKNEIADEPATNPETDVNMSNLAYAVYTSGSTGQPNGTLITHRAVTNHTLALIEKYNISAQDRRLQFASISSDVLIAETFPYLLMGGTVVLRPVEDFSSIVGFLEFLEERKITVIGLPSAFWHEWVAMLSEEDLPLPSSLRIVVAGMDRVRADLFAIWRVKIRDRIRWFNAYGPTEATCTSTLYEADLTSDEVMTTVPIGRPIPNARIYILDSNQNLVPVGVPGEIHIAGDGVALGYLNRPELTEYKFIRNPFGFSSNDVLYRTGDLGRYRADGNIEFVGRMDQQIKLRGHRIEPGEIESTLGEDESIREAVVMCREDTTGENRLVAYVEPRSDSIDIKHSREMLRHKLPGYMIPSEFVVVEDWPLTPNGKIDREQLPPPTWTSVQTSQFYSPPVTATERILSTIWVKELNLERVSVHDSFFDLGGDSLKAMRVLNQIRLQLGFDVPLAVLFHLPTIAEIARAIDDSLKTIEG